MPTIGFAVLDYILKTAEVYINYINVTPVLDENHKIHPHAVLLKSEIFAPTPAPTPI